MSTSSFSSIAREGFLFIISAPSGVGKTTVAHHVLALEKGIEISISVTTRLPRPLEKEGKDYYFVDEPTFLKRLEEGYFLEHAVVYNHYYGTPRAKIEEKLKEGKDILFDIDWQGAQQLKTFFPSSVVCVFLLPPSLATLEERLGKRAQDSSITIAQRMQKVKEEVSHCWEYDYILVNEDLEETVKAVRAIIQAERLKRTRERGLVEFVRALEES